MTEVQLPQHITAAEERLLETIRSVRSAIGGLATGYDEHDAINLLKALGTCETFAAPALNHLHTTQHEKARREYHGVCVALEGAIRRAVGRPDRSQYRAEVVRLVKDLAVAAKTVQVVFGWRERAAQT